MQSLKNKYWTNKPPPTNLGVVRVKAMNSHRRRGDLHGVKIKAWKHSKQPVRGKEGQKQMKAQGQREGRLKTNEGGRTEGRKEKMRTKKRERRKNGREKKGSKEVRKGKGGK